MSQVVRPDLEHKVSFMNQLDSEEKVENAIRSAIDENNPDQLPKLLEQLDTFQIAKTLQQMRYVDHPVCKLFAYAIVQGASRDILEKFIQKQPPLNDNIAAYKAGGSKDMMTDRDTWMFYFGTPMQLAALAGNVEAIKYLNERGVELDSVKGDATHGCIKLRPIDLACLKGHAGVIEAFANMHFDFNSENEDGNPPLHAICAAKGNPNIATSVRALQNCGVDLTALNQQNKTALQLIGNNCDEIKQLLIQEFFYKALIDRNLELLSQMQQLGADLEKSHIPGTSALNILCGFMGGGDDTAQALANSREILPLIQFLVKAGARKDTSSGEGIYKGQTPLQILEGKVLRKIQMVDPRKVDENLDQLIEVLNEAITLLGGQVKLPQPIQVSRERVQETIVREPKRPLKDKKVEALTPPAPKTSSSSACGYISFAVGIVAIYAYNYFQE